MKYEKLMLVTFLLLAILTIGAVSASDETDNLAVSDEVVSSSVDDVIVSVGDDVELANENYTEIIGDEDDDFDDGTDEGELRDLNLDSSVMPSTVLKNGEYEDGYYICLPYDFEGQVTLIVDDRVKFDGYSYGGATDDFYLTNLDYGTHNWELTCVDHSGNYNPLTLNGTFEVTYFICRVPEHVVLGSNDYIYAYLSYGAYGTITVLINGEEYIVKSIDDEFPYYRISLSNLSIGNYNYEIIYSGYKKFDGISINGSFDVDYIFDNLFGGDYEVAYGDPVSIWVGVPQDLTGKVTAVVNGKTFNFDVNSTFEGVDDNSIILKLSNFRLGENIVTISYSGNEKYSAKSFNVTVNVDAQIKYDYEMLYTNPYISLTLPETANGNLIVKIDGEDFANVTGNNGVFNVSLAGLTLKNYDLEAVYDGEDFEVLPVYTSISIVPKITVPEIVGIYEGALITIEVPDDCTGNFKIYSLDPWYWDYDDGYGLALVNATEVTNGKATLLLTSFENVYYYGDYEGKYNAFRLVFENEYYTYSQSYYPTMRYFDRNTDFSINVPEHVVKDTELVCYSVDKFARTYEVYVDEVYKGSYYNYKNTWEEWEDIPMEINITGLGYGKHKIEFRYVDEDGFYNPINKTYFFNVDYVVFSIPEEIIDDGEIYVYFEENLTGSVTLFINGELYGNINLQYFSGYESFYIHDLDYATYECELVYSGDANHEKVTQKASFDFTYPFYLNGYDDAIDVVSGENKDITVRLPWDVTGNVTVTVNGKKYTAKAHDYTDFTIDNFGATRNTFAITYEGDSKYPARTITKECVVYYDIVFKEDGVYLSLPSNATGNLVVTVNDNDFQTVKLVDGKAYVKLDSLPLGSYEVCAKYDGDDYKLYAVVSEDYNNYNITAPEKIGIEEGAIITVNSPIKFNGELIVEHIVATYNDEDDWWDRDFVLVNSTNIVNGFGSLKLTTFDGVVDYEDDGYDGEYFNDYRIVIKKDGEAVYDMRYYPKVVKKNSNFGLYVDAPSEVLKNDYMDVFTNMPETGYANVYIDGNYYKRFYGEIGLSVYDLDYGTHTIDVFYVSDGFYANQRASDSFNVTYMQVLPGTVEIYGEDELSFFTIEMDSGVTGYLTVNIDGKTAFMDFASSYVTVALSDLTVGNHSYEVIYSGDGNYSQLTKKGTFNAAYFGDLSFGSIYEGKPAEIYAYVINDATGSIELTIGGKTYTQNVVNGTALFLIEDLAEGEYNITAKYSGDDKYPAYSIYDDILDVWPKNHWYYINMDKNTCIEYGEDILIDVEMPNDVEGSLIVKIDNKLYNQVELVNGKAQITISNLTYGDYKIYAYYNGDCEYDVASLYEDIHVSPVIDYNFFNLVGSEIIVKIELPSDANGNVEVYDEDDNVLVTTQKAVNGKATLNLTDKLGFGGNSLGIKYNDGKYKINESIYVAIYPNVTLPGTITGGDDEEATFIFPESFNGNLDVYFASGVKVSKTVINGKATVSLSNLSAGRYYMRFVYDDGVNYFASGGSYAESVNHEIRVVDSGLGVTVYNSTKDTVVKFDDANASGSVIAKIDGKYYYSEIVDGKAVFDVAGNDVKISYSGDKNYGMFKDKAVNLSGEEPNLIDLDLIVNVEDIDVGGVAVVNIETNATFNGNVTVTVNNKDYIVNVRDGKGSVSVSDLTVDAYDVSVKFTGNDVFKESENATSFKVNKLVPTITVNALDSIVEKSDLAVEVAVPGATGVVIINGKEFVLVDGKATMTIPDVKVGTETINVSYSGDDRFLNATASKTVNVFAKLNPNLVATVENIKVGESAVVNISINENVTGIVTVDGQAVVIVNGKGIKEIPNLPIGNYNVTVSFAGDSLFISYNVTVSFSVKAEPVIEANDLTVQYNAGKYYSVTVYGEDGNAAAGVEVIFTLNGKQIAKATTNENGIAKFKVKQTPVSNAKLVSSALGVNATKKLTVKHILTLKKVTVKKSAKKLVLTATLKKVNGKYLKGKKITFKFNGKKFTAKTDKKGVAKVIVKSSVLKKLKVGKKIAYTATYVKDTVKRTVKVKK